MFNTAGLLSCISISSEEEIVISLLRVPVLVDLEVAVLVADEKKAFGSSMSSSLRSCSGTSSPVTLWASSRVSSLGKHINVFEVRHYLPFFPTASR